MLKYKDPGFAVISEKQMDILQQSLFYMNQTGIYKDKIDIQLQLLTNVAYINSCHLRIIMLSVFSQVHIDDIFTIISILDCKSQIKVNYQFSQEGINNDILRIMYKMNFDEQHDMQTIDTIIEISEQKQRFMANIEYLNLHYKLKPDRSMRKFQEIFKGQNMDKPNEIAVKYAQNISKLMLHSFPLNYVYQEGRYYNTLQGFSIMTAFRT